MKFLCLLIALCAVTLGFAQTVPDYFLAVGDTLGKGGTQNADGSYRINFPRTDVHFKSGNGMEIPADLGLATYIAMSGNADRVLAVGDVAMLEPEIDGVLDALRAGGFEVVALHNHMSTEEPRLFFTHFQASGDPRVLAASFKKALAVLGHGIKRPSVGKSKKPVLDVDGLSAVFGGKPQTFPSGVVRFANPRKDISVSVLDQSFLPGIGLGSWAAFSACDCGLTMAMGDTCCVRGDLQQAIDAYRRAGIHITSIHNHTLGGSQEVIFMHIEAEGDAVSVAKGIKSAWSVLGAAK
jgi:hypothetical protein